MDITELSKKIDKISMEFYDVKKELISDDNSLRKNILLYKKLLLLDALIMEVTVDELNMKSKIKIIIKFIIAFLSFILSIIVLLKGSLLGLLFVFLGYKLLYKISADVNVINEHTAILLKLKDLSDLINNMGYVAMKKIIVQEQLVGTLKMYQTYQKVEEKTNIRDVFSEEFIALLEEKYDLTNTRINSMRDQIYEEVDQKLARIKTI